MANKNRNLNDAARAKKDEFYTQLEDIERELYHEEYREFFKGKTVLCNCDDPYESEFFKYFAMNFNALELKKLIVTCYAGSPVAQTELNFDTGGTTDKKHRNEYAYKVIINEFKDWNGDGREDLEDIKEYILSHRGSWERLQGNGDFRSAECIELLKEADVVVTNPPFSLFREYVAQLMQYNKKFVILGNKNAITYKEIFPLIQQNKIWIGYTPMGRDLLFTFPEKYKKDFIKESAEGSRYRIIDGQMLARAAAIWYTNIPLKKYKEELLLVCSYYENPEKYPKYDNYDAIEVSRVAEIPYDYFGDMGVPITFLDKHNPDQFEIVKFRKGDDEKDLTYTVEDNTILTPDARRQTPDARRQTPDARRQTPDARRQLRHTSESSSGAKCNGVIGVPITFLDKYNPNQFEILGCTYQYGDCGCHVNGTSWGAKINGKDIYKRLFIRRKM